MLEECRNVSRTKYLAVLHRTNTRIRSYGDSGLLSGIDVLTEANLKTGDLAAYCDVLTKIASTQRGNHKLVGYEPTIVLGTSGIDRDDVLALSFAGYVLGQVQGTIPTAGHLVTLGGERRWINLQAE